MPKHELKRALESYWAGQTSAEQLVATGRELRRTHWQIQQSAGIDVIPSGDFSFYDGMLDTIAPAWRRAGPLWLDRHHGELRNLLCHGTACKKQASTCRQWK